MDNINQYQLILRINGKDTPIASWEDQHAGDLTLELVRFAYKQLLSSMIDGEPRQQESDGKQHHCEIHHVPMTARKSKYRDGVWYSCPHKNEDGTYCKYKPQKS